jgi:3-phenylpropionate/trans-cinnamate dioxygenase ferredoxin component
MSEFVTVAQRSELAAGQTKVVVVNGQRLALCNVEGEFFAIEDRCSHDDGPLGEGVIEGHEIECPRHGAKFDVTTGRPTCLPAVMPVNRFDVRLEGDAVQVAVDSR